MTYHDFLQVYKIRETRILLRSQAVFYNRRAHMVSYKARQALMQEASRAYIRGRAEQSPLTATPNGHVTTIRPPDVLPGHSTLSRMTGFTELEGTAP